MGKNNVVIIGANYGDEGKGLMSLYFKKKFPEAYTILTNGGAQRGHTAETKEGIRHEFHHFASSNIFTYKPYTILPKQYLLNPMEFVKEYDKLKTKPLVFIDKKCKLTTYIDMIINRLLEDKRGNKRHGSCGMGINETLIRYENLNYFPELFKKYTYDYFYLIDWKNNISKLESEFGKLLNLYFKSRVFDLKLYVPNDLREILFKDNGIIKHYLHDLKIMVDHSKLLEDNIYDDNDLIFENAQGLLLDQDNKENFPNVTHSHTGFKGASIVYPNIYNKNLEINYITRSYITRHGAGPFPTECKKEDISQDIEYDKTNITNDYQGSIRYGRLDIKTLISNIKKDIPNITKNITISLSITHLNEYNIIKYLSNEEKELLNNTFDKFYLSNTKYYDDIKEINKIL